MYPITTKSMQKKTTKRDGLRVCIMHHIKAEYDFDLWIPNLAPSNKLFESYIKKKEISWSQFSKLYLSEIKGKSRLLETIVLLSQKTNISLLCWEKALIHKFI